MSPHDAPNPSQRNTGVFTPPSGGDITLRSSDGVDFLVHSTHLKLASSVFFDMISTSTNKDVVRLGEDAIGISYLLRFIYPNRLPLAIDHDALSICLAVVQKYDVGDALEIIDELIALNTLPHKLLSSDPVRAYQLAVRFNLAKTKVVAAPLITVDRVDFCDLDKVSEHAQKYSSRKLISLMNIQAMRAKVLSDVLLKFDESPVLPAAPNPNLYFDLSCLGCQRNVIRQGGYKKFPHSWVLAWIRLTYETLLVSSEPLAKSDHLFLSTILDKFKGREDVCQACLSDFDQSDSQGPEFNRWAYAIKEVLGTQMAKLELVYAL